VLAFALARHRRGQASHALTLHTMSPHRRLAVPWYTAGVRRACSATLRAARPVVTARAGGVFAVVIEGIDDILATWSKGSPPPAVRAS